MSTVLVTGGSGFIATHCILRLLLIGHQVRTTLRDPGREPALRAVLAAHGVDPGPRLVCVQADLSADAGWTDAAAGCHHVLHVASPFPLKVPRNADDLVRPARDGTERVLRAAVLARARRVVVTSSFAAVGYGHPDQDAPFTEDQWTALDGADVQPYIRSKTVAERAAWDFMAREGQGVELATVNPVAVMGPALAAPLSSSVEIVRMMLDGRMPVVPRILFGVVDVRDVADLHLRAMTHPAAAGQRFLATAGPSVSLRFIGRTLRERLGDAAHRAPRRELPDWLVRTAGALSPTVREAVPHLGRVRSATSAKAQALLGWTPRPAAEAIEATARSLIALGLVRGASKSAPVRF